MIRFAVMWRRTLAPGLLREWNQHSQALMRIAIAFMLVAAIGRLGSGFAQLLSESGVMRAKDLKFRYEEVHNWFASLPVYGAMELADYPPASYAILWPFLGWLEFAPARWLWAFTTSAALVWLAYFLAREAKSRDPYHKVFIILLVAAAYPTHITVGGGQLINHVLPALLAGIFLVLNEKPCLSRDLLGGTLLIFSLVKPTVSVPFIWIVCFATGRLRAILIVVLGYISITLIAGWFQFTDPAALIQAWLAQSKAHTTMNSGHAHVHRWLTVAGLESWQLPVSCFLLLVLGWWTWRNRQLDIWVILGVTALFSRFWAYHRLQDDLLIIVPMVSLYRMAADTQNPSDYRAGAGVLCALAWGTIMAPARILASPAPLPLIMEAMQTAVWLVMLAFLLYHVPARVIPHPLVLSDPLS